MHICYACLSPTFGIHQGTADLANLLIIPTIDDQAKTQPRVTVLTIFGAPVDRYAPGIEIKSIVAMRGTGLQSTSFSVRSFWKVYRAIVDLKPDVVHFNGPHIWNPILLLLLRRAGVPTVQTIHDLDPHSGAGYGRMLYVWNDLVVRAANHILVYGQVYRNRLLARGLAHDRVTHVPLLHLFLSYDSEQRLLRCMQTSDACRPANSSNDKRFALFFARLEAYKGVDVLIEALRRIEARSPQTPAGATRAAPISAIIAGKGDIHRLVAGPLPGNVEVRNRLIEDSEAIELFSQCSVVVLPYVDATQSALIAAAYFFRKPVIVTRTGALPEYVVDGKTGWIIEPGNPEALAQCLQSALGDPDRLAEMGEAGRAWYQAQRCIERSVLHAMYEHVQTRKESRGIIP